jgi:hypothetical protein
MEDYKEIVEKIKNLHWNSLNGEELQQLMILSAYSAIEFAESLRITLNQHPNNETLKEMASEELKTATLSFEDYSKVGDHAEFLWHFINKHKLLEKYPRLKEIGEKYLENIRKLSNEIKVMSIVSREQELPGIFENILTAKKWEALGLQAYEYYLKQHIILDSKEGGHADMLKDFKINNDVSAFYLIRLELYKSIPELSNE